MEESSKSFKNHIDKRITEMRERVRNLKAEKVKEKMRKIAEIQKNRSERVKRKK